MQRIRLLNWWFLNEVIAIPWRLMSFVFIISIFLIPLFNNEPYILRVIILTNIYAIYAASWDLLAGYTGQFNLGHALFFGIAAYTAALLDKHFSLAPYLTIPIGAVAASLVGLVVAIPAFKTRGMYLSLITLAFPIILMGLVRAFPDFTGGEMGIYGLSPMLNSRVGIYYVVLIVMLMCVAIMWKLTDIKSKIVRTGVIFHAIREDEITARSSGIDTTKYKLLAFSISGFMAGIAGGLYAHFMQVVGPSTLELSFSFYAILWSIFGGMMTISGPVLGVYLLYPLFDLMRINPALEQIRMIIMGLVLILVLLFMPGGIAHWIRDKIEIICPRCKIINWATRKNCRVCDASLHLEKEYIQET
jgi:branched-chain amino acid transport system permease protein